MIILRQRKEKVGGGGMTEEGHHIYFVHVDYYFNWSLAFIFFYTESALCYSCFPATCYNYDVSHLNYKSTEQHVASNDLPLFKS